MQCTKKTKKINESFVCVCCKKIVPLAQYTCRNHCPFCFVSLHVDGLLPGDRKSSCGGIMYPDNYEIRNGQTKILFVCIDCGKKHRNKSSVDDDLINLVDIIKQKLDRNV